MNAVDTNVLIRLIMRDDPEQFTQALNFCLAGVFVTTSVVMETEWVLRSRFKMSRQDIVIELLLLMDSADFHFQEDDAVRWALTRYLDGADFADMTHLVASKDMAGFATFDQRLPTQAGKSPVSPVVLIA